METPEKLLEEPGKKNNTLALVSLITGVVGILSSCVGPFLAVFIYPLLSPFCLGGGGLLGIASLVTGIMGNNQIKKSADAEGGKGMAISGIVLGILNILIPCLLVLIVILLGSTLSVFLGPAIGEVFSDITDQLAP